MPVSLLCQSALLLFYIRVQQLTNHFLIGRAVRTCLCFEELDAGFAQSESHFHGSYLERQFLRAWKKIGNDGDRMPERTWGTEPRIQSQANDWPTSLGFVFAKRLELRLLAHCIAAPRITLSRPADAISVHVTVYETTPVCLAVWKLQHALTMVYVIFERSLV